MSTENLQGDIGNRIKLVREHSGLKQNSFARSIGISQSYLSELLNNAKMPSQTILIAISLRYAINLNWLLTGEGEMLLTREAKECPSGATDIVTEKILIMLEDLDEEEKRDVLKYLDKAKHKKKLEERIKQLEARLDEGTSKEAG